MSGRTIIIEYAEIDAPCLCSNCEWSGPARLLKPVTDCVLTPGDPSPAGRCPEEDCDSLAYLDRPVDRAVDQVRDLYDGEGNLKLMPGDDRAAMAVEDARQVAEQFGVVEPVDTSLYWKVIEQGYLVGPHPDGGWELTFPDAETDPDPETPFATEAAAYEAADNHRMFGDVAGKGGQA